MRSFLQRAWEHFARIVPTTISAFYKSNSMSVGERMGCTYVAQFINVALVYTSGGSEDDVPQRWRFRDVVPQ